MNGHALSGSRKLNKHWQSGNSWKKTIFNWSAYGGKTAYSYVPQQVNSEFLYKNPAFFVPITMHATLPSGEKAKVVYDGSFILSYGMIYTDGSGHKHYENIPFIKQNDTLTLLSVDYGTPQYEDITEGFWHYNAQGVGLSTTKLGEGRVTFTTTYTTGDLTATATITVKLTLSEYEYTITVENFSSNTKEILGTPYFNNHEGEWAKSFAIIGAQFTGTLEDQGAYTGYLYWKKA